MGCASYIFEHARMSFSLPHPNAPTPNQITDQPEILPTLGSGFIIGWREQSPTRSRLAAQNCFRGSGPRNGGGRRGAHEEKSQRMIVWRRLVWNSSQSRLSHLTLIPLMNQNSMKTVVLAHRLYSRHHSHPKPCLPVYFAVIFGVIIPSSRQEHSVTLAWWIASSLFSLLL